MNSIDQRPVNTLTASDADGVPGTQAGNPSDLGAIATSHPPFDMLLTGLHQMILLGQAACPQSRRASTRDGGKANERS